MSIKIKAFCGNKKRVAKYLVTSTRNAAFGKMTGQLITSCVFETAYNCTCISNRLECIRQIFIGIIQKILASYKDCHIQLKRRREKNTQKCFNEWGKFKL